MKTPSALSPILCRIAAILITPAMAQSSVPSPPMNPTGSTAGPDKVPQGLEASEWTSIRVAHESWQHSVQRWRNKGNQIKAGGYLGLVGRYPLCASGKVIVGWTRPKSVPDSPASKSIHRPGNEGWASAFSGEGNGERVRSRDLLPRSLYLYPSRERGVMRARILFPSNRIMSLIRSGKKNKANLVSQPFEAEGLASKVFIGDISSETRHDPANLNPYPPMPLMNRNLILGLTLALVQTAGATGLSALFQTPEVEYRPGGGAVDKVWTRFYAGDYEAELSVPLIKAGRAMTPAINEAIAHRDMKYRRYAIGALGHIGDRRALPQLESILKSRSERDYFRADALEAISQIDESLGYKYATQYQRANGLLGSTAQTITDEEMSAILGALTARLQKAVRKPAKFRANQVNVENGWAFVRGVPEASDGKPMNYTGTPYAEQVELGMFDNNFSGLLRKKNGNWSVVTWNIGATDVVYAGWADAHGAPATLIK